MRSSVRRSSWYEPWRDTSTFRPMATPSILTFTYPPPQLRLRAHFTGGHPTSLFFLRYTHDTDFDGKKTRARKENVDILYY